MTPNWRWELASSAGKDLERLIPEQRPVIQKLDNLATGAPNVDVKRIGHNEYRMRVGDLRIVLAKDAKDQVITVTRIADRKDVSR